MLAFFVWNTPMAGDWIKMRTDLGRDPAVIRLAEIYGWEEHVIVGLLHKLWSWADEQVSDGNANGVTGSFLDRYLGVTGFADNLISVGWLGVNEAGIEFPNWERHMGKSAKTRATTALRVAKSRNGGSVTKSLPEKRREEKRREEIKKESKPKKTAMESLESQSAFNQFWLSYPNRNGRKVGKPKAIEQWKKIPRADHRDIFTGTANYKAEIGEFAVDAHRFLRDKIYRDYLGDRAPDNGKPKVANVVYEIPEERTE